MTVKYIAEIETPTDHTGYLVDGNMFVPFDEGNRHYGEVQEWIAEGNVVEEAYTPEEIIEYAKRSAKQKMKEALEAITVEVDGHTYSASTESTTHLQKAYAMAVIHGGNVPVFDIDGDVVYVTEDQLKTISGLMLSAYNSILQTTQQ